MAKDSIDFKVTADAKKAFAEIVKLRAEVNKLSAKLGEVGAAGKASGKQVASLGESTGRFVRNAIGIGSAAVALRTFVGFQRESDALAKAASSQIDEQISGRRRLAQIQQSPAFAKDLAGQAGISIPDALEFQFQGRSLGFTDAQIRDLGNKFAQFATPGTEPQLLKSIAQFRANFSDFGTPAESLDKLLTAAENTALSVDEIGTSSRAAGAFKQIGGSGDEILAFAATAAKAAEPEIAITAVRAFITQLAEKFPEFKNLGALGATKELIKRFTENNLILTGEMLDAFTNVRAALGASFTVEGISNIERDLKRIVEAPQFTGTSKSATSKAIATVGADPAQLAVIAQRRAVSQGAATTERAGIEEKLTQALFTKIRSILTKQRVEDRLGLIPGVTEGIASGLLSVADITNVSPEKVAALGRQLIDQGDSASQQDIQDFLQFATNTLGDQQRPGARNEQLRAEQEARSASDAVQGARDVNFSSLSPQVSKEQMDELIATGRRTAVAAEEAAKPKNQRLRIGEVE